MPCVTTRSSILQRNHRVNARRAAGWDGACQRGHQRQRQPRKQASGMLKRSRATELPVISSRARLDGWIALPLTYVKPKCCELGFLNSHTRRNDDARNETAARAVRLRRLHRDEE